MNTFRRPARLILAVAGAVAIVATSVLVVPGLAGAGDGGVAPGVPEPAPRAETPNPDAAVSSPALPYDPNHWTSERMANAKPMPMPTVP